MFRRTKFWLCRFARVSAFALPLLFCGLLSAAEDDLVSFNRDIRPIFADRCYKCHGPDQKQRKADLRLDVRKVAVESAIVAGDATKGELLARITSSDPEARMPPVDSNKKPLGREQIELIRRWIDQGAKYEKHWSFISPRRPKPAAVKNESWIHSPIDRFVLARLERERLQPSRTSDRRTLIRRVSLDLTGLPPSPTDVTNFVNDKSPEAYGKLVNRLLESKYYGEHMARYWLDAARYADTNGYQYDLEREQWVWRDWVIHAFNSNMPFDQFTVEQLGGDLLPNATDQQKLATAFNRNHPITIEGGVIDEEYRTEYVVDRVVTTSTTWMGLTFLCSRCHDHKFDPISQNEFYQFFAFFNQVPERGNNGFAPKLKLSSPLQADQVEQLDKQIAESERQFKKLASENGERITNWTNQLAEQVENQWTVTVPVRMTSEGGTEFTEQADKSVLAGGKNSAVETYELILHADARPIRAIRLEALTHPSHVNKSTGRGSNGNFVLSEFEVAVASHRRPNEFKPVKIVTAEADYSQKNYNIALAIDGKADRTGWAVDGNTKHENRSAVFTLAEPVGNDGGSRLRIRMIHRYGGSHHIGRFRLALATGTSEPIPIRIAAIVGQRREQRSAAQRQQVDEFLLQRFGSPKLRKAGKQLNALRRRRNEIISAVPATMVMTDMPQPRATHVLYRGEYDKPRNRVEPGTPGVFPAIPAGAPRNRLGLARWLVMPEHPLTARVTVNRFWQRLFGIGLVKTTEDFGTQGEWPTHPDLLDWLAVEFVESGWDVKALLKTIVMSATYRQSSRVTPQLMARDPQNRLLARGPRMRLDAEVIRDSALFVSGQLVGRIGGPSVFPYHPKGLWQEINNRPGYSRVYKRDIGEKLYRRSLYTFWKRTVPPPSMATFDAPEREFCVVQRSRTNTPLQAFVMLHDPQFVEAARHLAARMMQQDGLSTADRIGFGFEACVSRRPNAAELAVLMQMFKERLKQYRVNRQAAERLLAVGESPRDGTLNLAEHAAFTTIARMLLNLSEFITKA